MSTDFVERYGPWALVTGAANGLGAAFAAELVSRGVRVLGVDRDEAGLRAQRERHGTAAFLPVVADLAEVSAEGSILAGVGERTIGLVVSCAAERNLGDFFTAGPSRLHAVQRVNCDLPLWLCHTFGGPMRQRGRGGLVLVSSLSSVAGAPLIAQYAATKAFTTVLAESLHEELAGSGVHVATVLAPLVDTPGLHASGPSTTQGAMPPVRVARATLDRLGRRVRFTTGAFGQLMLHGLTRLLPRRWVRWVMAMAMRRLYPQLHAELRTNQ